MKCTFCSHSETKVIDSRESEDLTRRRRECLKCEKRFTTYERVETVQTYVIKKDGSRELFDREKLSKGLLKACEKRPISMDTIDLIVAEVEYELKDYVMEISSKVIGEKVMEKLHAIDQVAYVRFASVYRNFSDVNSFLEEIDKLKNRKEKNALSKAVPSKISKLKIAN